SDRAVASSSSPHAQRIRVSLENCHTAASVHYRWIGGSTIARLLPMSSHRILPYIYRSVLGGLSVRVSAKHPCRACTAVAGSLAVNRRRNTRHTPIASVLSTEIRWHSSRVAGGMLCPGSHLWRSLTLGDLASA